MTREQIEDQLLSEMNVAYQRYMAKARPLEEYRRALHRFNDFILRGILPEHLKSAAKPVAAETGRRKVPKKA